MMRRNFLLLVIMFFPAWTFAAPEVQQVRAGPLTAWLVEDHHVPMLHVQLLFTGAGGVSDPEPLQGRAVLAARTLLKGAGELDDAAYSRALQDKAIELSASAGRDHLQVRLTTLREHRDTAFALMADALLRPRFDTASLEELRGQMDSQRRAQAESPYYLAGKLFRERAYRNHPYAQELLGSDVSMAALGPEELRAYLRRYVTGDNVIISVAGAISAEELRELLREHLADLPKPDDAPEDIAPVVWPAQPFDAEDSIALPQSLLMFSRPGMKRSDSRFYAAYLLNHSFGGGTLTSILGEEIRKKRGLTYGISTDLQIDAYATRWGGSVATQAETADEARMAIIEQARRVAEAGITPEQLAAAKSYVTGSFPLQLDSNTDIADYLTIMQLYELGADYLTKRNGFFEAVTLEEVNILARQWLDPDSWSWVTVGPQSDSRDAVLQPVSSQ